ncbi:MAG: CehA/McbA family metallohydrolase [Planctomycetaceae bacterium]
MALIIAVLLVQSLRAHEGHQHTPQVNAGSKSQSIDNQVAESYHRLWTKLIEHWPTPQQEQLISQAWLEQQALNGDANAAAPGELKASRKQLLVKLFDRVPSIEVTWDGTTMLLHKNTSPLSFCRTLTTPLFVAVHNRSGESVRLRPRVDPRFVASDHAAAESSISEWTDIAGNSECVFLVPMLYPADAQAAGIEISFDHGVDSSKLVVPVQLTDCGILRGTVVDDDQRVPARVTVISGDGMCRFGGQYAEKSTLTKKPIIYPPIGGWQRMTYFYSDGTFELKVPPGEIEVIVERGFHHQRGRVSPSIASGQIVDLAVSCEPLVDMKQLGWISGDTHVHWVTNQWNVDEPLELLALVQRAEGLMVANNLTLLQRYANEAFIKPSQAPMGPVAEFSDTSFHIQMGEEYRNEDLYGHLNFLNIDWLVQPIGTGSIIAGPDAIDYPLNRTAIQACRQQGGISIEAHGTGGNKDVPVNVIHNLTDSLDQMEPEMYYRLLDCGFRLPLTNGSDHPARPLGAARCYAKVDGQFYYPKWIEAVRQGRTFTTSGPLIFLTVDDHQIGDVVTAGHQQSLTIRAHVISREPIGQFQIISNGDVIAETYTEQTTAELELAVAPTESCWIVARCSHRDDGNADWGFGNFNAITGPGIAHTSPIYVEVDGRVRFDPAAAAFWQDQIRDHLRDVQAKGRFATESQLAEAVRYLEHGMEMFAQLESHIHSARQRNPSWQTTRDRMIHVLRRFGGDAESAAAIDELKGATNFREVQAACEPLVLFDVSVNPESRVKISSRRDRIRLHQQRPERFLIKVENTAGITAPLNLSAIDVALNPPTAADWLSVEVVDSPFTSRFFTGDDSEYKVMQLTSHLSGLRESRIIGDAGQGTQDLGFRATSDVLLEIRPKWSSSNGR